MYASTIYVMFICRYQRGSRSLADNLVAPPNAKVPALSGGILPANEVEEGYDIPEEMEDVIGKIIRFGLGKWYPC